MPSSDNRQGLFDLAPNQTTVLLLDFKTEAIDLLPQVQQSLEPLRQDNYLSFWDGDQFVNRPITVALTGNAPYEHSIDSSMHRDIFFDVPFAKLQEQVQRGQTKQWNTSNAIYASTSFAADIGALQNGRPSSHQLNTLRAQIKAAKSQGLKVRYWATPSWPTSLRNYVWQLLLDEGADVLNVDDLRAAAFLDWRKVRHTWIDT